MTEAPPRDTPETGLAALGRRLAEHLGSRVSRPDAIVWQPEPPAAGDPVNGARLAQGVVRLDGVIAETRAPNPWAMTPPAAVWETALHGHGWLDDMAAAGEWGTARRWVRSWQAAPPGLGPLWHPELVARRLVRWLCHAPYLLQDLDPAGSEAFFEALAGHVRRLTGAWRQAAPGADRIEALAGLVYAGLGIEAVGPDPQRAINELAIHADATIGRDGTIASRNGAELARILALLDWAGRVITAAGRTPPPALAGVAARARPVLGALGHTDGGLGRFHGAAGSTDAPPPPPGAAMAMGYVRLAAGEMTVLLDAAPARSGKHSPGSHSAPLALEISAGAAPLIVNRGPGHGFGPEAEAEARGAAAHSTLWIPGGHDIAPGARASARLSEDTDGLWALAESEGWQAATGLTLERRLHLTLDGQQLSCEDTVLATDSHARAVAARALGDTRPEVRLRLILHPDVRAVPGLGGRAMMLTLASGAGWLLTVEGGAPRLYPTVFHEPGRILPRATQEIVVSVALVRYWGRISWSLARLPDV